MRHIARDQLYYEGATLSSRRIREGDLLETVNGLIFDVKGLLHPPARAIAYLRYLPDRRGTRRKADVRYRKVYSLKARTSLLAKRWPKYLYTDPVFHREVQAVPLDEVRQHYVPTERLEDLTHDSERDRLEQQAVDLVGTLERKTGISRAKVGVSGSLLVDLHTPRSDIDLILYGADASRKCHKKLKTLVDARAEGLSPHETSDLRALYRQRELASAMAFNVFAKHERSKVLQGKFRGAHYFIRCVKEWSELHEAYGDKQYYPIGRAIVRAIIASDDDSIFTPCNYGISDVQVIRGHPSHVPAQITSFRGRFCEQAHTGNRVVAEGLLERVVDQHGEHCRLVIGEAPRDRLMAVERRE